MPNFEIIDHTADIGLVAFGTNRKEVFINAALGMFSIIIDQTTVKDSRSEKIAVDADDYEELLVTWLNELLYLFDAENLVFSSFEISYLDQNKLNGTAWGEEIDLSRHEIKTPIKAATYHKLKLIKEGDGFRVKIILDI